MSLSEDEKKSITLLAAYHDDFQTKEAIIITYLIGIFIGAHVFTSLTVLFESVFIENYYIFWKKKLKNKVFYNSYAFETFG